MTPERPKTLTVLDYMRTGTGLGVHVDRWDPLDAVSELVVSWAATGRPGPNWYAAADGAVWVAAPQGYQWNEYDADVSPPDPNHLGWADATSPGGYLMLVAVLPAGYVLDPTRGGDPPREIKVVGERLAAWWMIVGRGSHSWYIRELTPVEALGNVAAQLQQHVRDDGSLTDPPVDVENVARWPGFRSPTPLPADIRGVNTPLGVTATGAMRDAIVLQSLRVARSALLDDLGEFERRQVSALLSLADAVLRASDDLTGRASTAATTWMIERVDTLGAVELLRLLRTHRPESHDDVHSITSPGDDTVTLHCQTPDT